MQKYYDLLMLWIVLHGGRPACLISIPKRELAHPKSKRVRDIFDFIHTHQLFTQIETKKDVEEIHKLVWAKRTHVNLLISKKYVPHDFGDKHLRKVLAFRYGKPDFRSDRRSSIFPIIDAYDPITNKTVGLWSYNGEPKPATRTHARALFSKWQNILKKHPFPWVPSLQLSLRFEQRDGYFDRAKHIQNTDYFLKHYRSYIADLENEVEVPISVLQTFSIKPISPQAIDRCKSEWLKWMRPLLDKNNNNQ